MNRSQRRATARQQGSTMAPKTLPLEARVRADVVGGHVYIEYNQRVNNARLNAEGAIEMAKLLIQAAHLVKPELAMAALAQQQQQEPGDSLLPTESEVEENARG